MNKPAAPPEPRVGMADLAGEYGALREDIDAAIGQVLESGEYVLGEELARFEEEFAAYSGTRYAVGVSSGTAALHLALLAAGIGPGAEVITAPNSDSPSAAAISHAGAQIVFAETDPRTFDLDPGFIEAAITPATRALLPVHLYGNPADMDEILGIAGRHELVVIEDAALAVGAEYRGRRVGSFGVAGAFSLAPSKILGAYGDGGIVTTDDAALADRLRVLRNYGHGLEMPPSGEDLRGPDAWDMAVRGFNERLDTLQAAILRTKLRTLDERIAARRAIAARYDQRLSGLDVETPRPTVGANPVWMAYTIMLDDRQAARDALESEGIASRLYYTPPLHLQGAFRDLGYDAGSFPFTESTASRMLSLPIHPRMTMDQVDLVCDVLGRHLETRRRPLG